MDENEYTIIEYKSNSKENERLESYLNDDYEMVNQMFIGKRVFVISMVKKKEG